MVKDITKHMSKKGKPSAVVAYAYAAAHKKLSTKLGRYPTKTELARELDCTPSSVRINYTKYGSELPPVSHTLASAERISSLQNRINALEARLQELTA